MACWLGGNSEFARYISDGDNDDDDNDDNEPNHLMMTELLLRLRAGLPVSELPRRRHSAMIEQNVRIWSHRAELSNIIFESGQRQIIQFSVAHREDAECHATDDDDLGDGLVTVVSNCHLILAAACHRVGNLRIASKSVVTSSDLVRSVAIS